MGNCGADPPGGEDRDGTYRPDHRFMFERGFCGLYLQKYPCRRDHFDKSIHDQQGEEAWNVYSSAFFLIDSMAIKNIENLGNQHEQLPDVVEVLPGVMPKILKQICKTSKVPVIAGGLISDKEDVMGALGAGAATVSTTNQKVWEL